MNRVVLVLATMAWCTLVFFLVGWLTFPSSAAASRATYEINSKVGAGRYLVSMDALSPWWFGASADRVMVSSVHDGVAEPFFFGDNLALRTGLFGLVRRSPTFTGQVTLGEGVLDVATDVKIKGGRYDVRRVEAKGSGLPVADLLGLATMGGGADVAVTGGLDVDVDLEAPGGWHEADGNIEIKGRDLVVDTITVAALGWVDKEIAGLIDVLDLDLRVDEGTAEIARGELISNLLEADIEGTLELAEQIDRSRLQLQVVLRMGDWSEGELAQYQSLVEGFLRGAQWSDGTYHYEVDTPIGRFDVNDMRPVPERSRNTRSVPNPGARNQRTQPSSISPVDRDFKPVDPSTIKRPTPITPTRASASSEDRVQDEEDEFDDEEEFVDEDDEFADEDLPDDEGLDDEPPVDDGELDEIGYVE